MEQVTKIKICTLCKELKPYSSFYTVLKNRLKIDSWCKSCKCKKRIEYYQNNKERQLAKIKEWRSKNKERLRLSSTKCAFLRYQTDVVFRITRCLRARFCRFNTKPRKIIKNLGITVPEFKNYIEAKFKPGMSWKNYGRGGWHLDHIFPLSAWNLKDPRTHALACHYTNFQPLWEFENISKHGDIIYETNTDPTFHNIYGIWVRDCPASEKAPGSDSDKKTP